MASTIKKQGFWSNIKEILILLVVVFLIRTIGFGLYQVPTGSMETTMLVNGRFFADKFTRFFRSFDRGDIISFNDPLFPYSENRIKRLSQDYLWGPSNWTKRIVGKPGDTVRGAIEGGKPVVYLNDQKLNETYLNKYPLIRVWKVDPDELQRIAFDLARKGLPQEYLGEYLEPKSIDPHRPYNDQPFYNIKPERILRIPGQEPELVYPNTLIKEKVDSIAREPGENFWEGSDEFYVRLGDNQYWVMGDNRLGSKDSRFFGPLDGRFIHGRILFCIWSIDSEESWWIVDLIKHPIDFWRRMRWSRCLKMLS